jgi:NADH-quinone oxidoreductase E subunit
MSFKFNQENLQKIEEIKKKYPYVKAAVMPALYLAQEQNGFITLEVMSEVANVLNINQADVLGVVTFYTMFHTKKPGKYHIQVCTNVSCMLRGAYEILDAIKKELKIENGETAADGKYSLEEVECMGACGGAPMIAINEDYYENLTVEKALELLKNLE